MLMILQAIIWELPLLRRYLFACNEDDYLAFSLSMEKTTLMQLLAIMISITHTVMPEKIYNDRLCERRSHFSKLFDEFQEATGEKVKEKTKHIAPFHQKKFRSGTIFKEIVRQYVLENKCESSFPC